MSRLRSKKGNHDRIGPSQRQYRVGELIRKALVDIFDKVEIRDPYISNISITISEVSVSPDLKAARVFVMPLGGIDREKVISGLARANTFLRKHVATRVELRYTPRLEFKLDTAFDTSQQLNRILNSKDYSPKTIKILGKTDGTQS